MKKSNHAWALISVLLLCGFALASILFCFQMKQYGFSSMELMVMFFILILLNVLFSLLVLKNSQPTSTLVYVSIILIQLIVIMGLAMTILQDWIKMVFLL